MVFSVCFTTSGLWCQVFVLAPRKDAGGKSIGVNAMRSVLALGLLITLCAAANAAPLHHAKPRHSIVSRSQGAPAPARFAVPGWTDEQTEYWLDRGPSACAGCG